MVSATARVTAGHQREAAVVPGAGAAVNGDGIHSPPGQETRRHPAAMAGGADDMHPTPIGELRHSPGQLGQGERVRPGNVPAHVLVGLAHVDYKASLAVQLGELVDGDGGHRPPAEDT